MFKKGFTLQELLITLGIIGIVAAITGPAIVGLAPDKSKTMYMKAYNTLLNETNDIMDDPSLFWPIGYNQDGIAEETGLYSSVRPQVAPYNDDEHCQGTTKFPAILSHRLNLAGEPEYGDDSVTFTTIDGIVWTFNIVEVEIDTAEFPDDITAQSLGYEITLTIDVDGDDKGVNHSFDAEHMQADQFVFIIDNNGGVHAADALGMVYLQNPTDMHATKDDRSLAEQVVTNAKSSTDINKMSSTLQELKKKTSTSKT